MKNSFDYYKKVEKPNMYLCNPDRTPIGFVNSENRHLVLRFNDLSELTFTVPKIIGTESVYDRIETKRLLFIEKIGWFQIINVNNTISGGQETKEVTAESHQTQLKTRGFVSEERVYMFYNTNDPLDEKYDSNDIGAMPSIVGQLCQQLGIKVNLQIGNIEPTQDYGEWTLIYIDSALKFSAKSYDKQYESADNADNICRTFTEAETFGYDFIVNEVEPAFEVIFEFDYLHHTIKVKRLEDITKATNIYLSLDNVLESISVTENADNIITVLSCNGNDLDIRTVNPMGTNYIVNFDYYKKTVSDDGKIQYPWMSKELIAVLNEWEIEWRKWQGDDNSRTGHEEGYSTLVEKIQKLYEQQSGIEGDIQYANLKLTDLQAARDLQFKNDSTTNNGKGIISAEDVAVENKSLSPNSLYKNTAFTEEATVVAYVGAPTVLDDFTFSFSGTGKRGTVKSTLLDFISSTKGSDGHYDEDTNSTAYLYFTDDSTRKSYCKILVSAEIGVVKDSSGNISVSGTTEVKGITFAVTTSTNYFKVTYPDGTNTTVSKSNSYFIYNGARYKIVQSSDGIVTIYCFYVAGFRRFTTYKQLTGDNNWCNLWEKYVKSIDSKNKTLDSQIEAITEKMKYISEICHIQKYIKRCGDTLYNEFSNYWVEGEYSNDNLASTDSTTIAERISLAKELMEAGETELTKVSQPTFELSVSAVNFIKLLEFRPFTNELELGHVITIEKDENTHYRPALVSIEYDLDSTESFNLTFSTAGKLDETAMTFADLLNQSSSTSRTISANWSNLTDYWKNKDKITSLIVSPLDRTLRAAQANMSNQEFTVDVTGILGRKWSDDSHTDFEKEQVRIMNNTIMFTDDNWQTIRTALGKIIYNDEGKEKSAYGLIAEVLVGSLLVGEKLKIRNDSNTITLDETGITIKDSNNTNVFKAMTDGNVFIKGDIYATSLILSDGVKISFSKIDSVPDFATKSEVTETVSGELALYVKRDENNQIVSMLNAAADVIQITSNRLSIASDCFTLTSDGVISASAGHMGGLALAQSDGYYSSVFQSEEITKTLTVTIPRGTIGYGDGVSVWLWYAAVKEFSLADLGITDTNAALGEFTVQTVNETSTKAGLAGCSKSGVSVYAMVRGKGSTLTFDTNINVKITYRYYNIVRTQTTVSKLCSPDSTFDISSALSMSIFSTKNIRADNASVNSLNSPTAILGGITFNKECISANGINITFGSDSSTTVEAEVVARGNVLFVYCDTVIYFDKVLFVKYSNADANFDKIISVLIKSGTSFAKVEVPTFNEITSAEFVDSTNTDKTKTSFKAETPDDAAQYAYEERILYFDNPQLCSTGYYNSTYSTRIGGALGSANNYWNSLYAYNIYGINIYQNGTAITTSDRNLKNTISYFDGTSEQKYSDLFDKLRPVSFKYNNGEKGRTHWGFIAQDIEENLKELGLDGNDSAIFCEWEEPIKGGKHKICGIRYEELIPILTYEIQKLKHRVKELENTIKEPKGD